MKRTRKSLLIFILFAAFFISSCNLNEPANYNEGAGLGGFVFPMYRTQPPPHGEIVFVDRINEIEEAEPEAEAPDETEGFEDEVEIESETEKTFEAEPDDSEKFYSAFTGLPLTEEEAALRPVAVMINNMGAALPQSGISQADIIYEALAEGNVTRLVAVFQSFDAEKIGPIRSSRDYYIHFALDCGAVYVHHGGSPSGYARLRNLNVNRLDGMNLEGRYFWRDRTYPEWYKSFGQTRSLEHSSYTSRDNIYAAASEAGFSDAFDTETGYGFLFFEELTRPPGYSAVNVNVPFSRGSERTFEYDYVRCVYKVLNGEGPHVDELTREPLYVKNILIQQMRTRVVDDVGRREFATVGSGTGFLVTMGTRTPVVWEKEDDFSPTRWYLEDGEPMRINAGKTWICVFQDNGTAVFK